MTCRTGGRQSRALTATRDAAPIPIRLRRQPHSADAARVQPTNRDPRSTPPAARAPCVTQALSSRRGGCGPARAGVRGGGAGVAVVARAVSVR